ncbi:ABC transporter permease [Desulfosudis oleivorans]|uniref:ABC transporter-related protein n=1 Tax=Desulfosudis oleivorans (strain DSM 6200 / JCM 39069 / Hxd3) TaxID=96561 RepID=A9A031_DESOH|nr:ABC transporter permease [Desulfosudis oleivorans]ABW67431.1 ABC transporter-related protein [Desulfosudis oleivorans Hxd3]
MNTPTAVEKSHEILRLENLCRVYRSGDIEVHALRDISLTIEAGEFIAIMGPSGSGKSTLLHTLGLLDRPDSGTYTLFGRDTTKMDDDTLATLRNHLAGFVFQQFHLLQRSSALDNVALPLVYAGRRQKKDRAEKRLAEVGLSHRSGHRPGELSGGEQQRVAIARALVNNPAVIFADEPTGNLDTKSEADIMAVLKDLNRRGKTIIMVTHEKEVAEHAGRIILMRDGKIVSDEKKAAPVPGDPPPAPDLPDRGAGRIAFTDHLRQAFASVFSHKMRSFLSILGILIGVAAVIAMLALGRGAKSSIEESLKSLGSNLLAIRPGTSIMRGVHTAGGDTAQFTDADVTAVAKLPSIRYSTGMVGGAGQIVFQNKNWSTRVEGVGYDYGVMRASLPVVGRWFTKDELRRRAKVLLVGTTVARELFGETSPIGKTVKFNRINFTVIGVLPPKGSNAWRDNDDVVLMPVTTAMYRVLGKTHLDFMYAEALNQELMATAEQEVGSLLRTRQRLSRGQDDTFTIRNLSDIQETLTATTRTMGILLGAIAAISLLVGGIGIMNIMLVSVTERTREIGLRMAIGARSRDILMQFLIESVVMTFWGGLLGTLMGVGTAMALSHFAGWTTLVGPDSILLATVFSVAVGIGFGLWPARKAAHLNPVEALRYE